MEFDITGKRYGKLVVLRFDHYEKHNSYWLCQCDCGGQKVVKRTSLQEGKCRSCGCLRGRGRNVSPTQKIILTQEQEEWLTKHYKHTKNDECMERLGLTEASLHRYARKLGLKKTPQFINKCQREASQKAKASHLRNGTYPPKGYSIPRSLECGFQKGHTESARTKRKRCATLSVSMKKIRAMEKMRVMAGLPQKTKLKVGAEPRVVYCKRHNLRRLGYIVERGSHIAYYTPDTKRSAIIENKQKGDFGYCWMEFRPLVQQTI